MTAEEREGIFVGGHRPPLQQTTDPVLQVYPALTVLRTDPQSPRMSLPVAPVEKKKLPVVKLALVALVLIAGAVIVLRGMDLRALIEGVVSAIRAQGPLVFFTAMALLPAVGFPVLAFGLTAGPAFSEQLGMGAVVGCVLVAVTVNFLLCYALARRALRPVLEKLLKRFGYKLPEVEAGDAADLIVILRLTPGVPFFVQNYLAGLAEVKFQKYLLISCLIVWPFNAATVLFADAVVHGKGRVAITAFMLLAVVTAATHLARKHYARKKKAVVVPMESRPGVAGVADPGDCGPGSATPATNRTTTEKAE